MQNNSGKPVGLPHMSVSRFGIPQIAIFSIPIVWGTTFAVVQRALVDAGPMAFAVARFGLASIVFLIASKAARDGARVFFRPRTPDERRHRTDILILGAAIGAGYMLQTIGLLTTTTSKSAFLTSTTVIWTPIIAHFVGREKITKHLLVAVAITLSGVFLMTRPYEAHGLSIGDLLTIGCAAAFGVYIVWIDKAIHRAQLVTGDEHSAAIMVTSNQIIAATLIFIVFLPILETPRFAVTQFSIGALVYTAVFATGITAYLQTRYQNCVSPTAASVIYMLEPVVAMLVAELFLTEQIGFLDVLGGVLIILGVIIAQVKSRQFLNQID